MPIATALLALPLLTTTALADGDVEAGKALYAPCVECHGADGAGSKAKSAPRLSGQRDSYLERQLRYFKEGTRSNESMHEQAQAFATRTDQKNVVAYILTLDGPTPTDTITGDAAAGRTAWALCSQCHGGRGHGSSFYDTPRLAGQHDWYLLRQLEAFAKGHRGLDPSDRYGEQMQQAESMISTDKARRDVIAYINSLE